MNETINIPPPQPAPLAPLVVWAAVASNRGPRGMSDEILAKGPAQWCNDLGHRIAGKGATHCVIYCPGGMEDDGSDIRFDQIDRAAKHPDPRVQACGRYAEWADGCANIARIAGVKCGLYLGTSEGLTPKETLEVCEKFIHDGEGLIDFVVIDTIAGRPMGHTDHIAAHRFEAAKIQAWGEARPPRGFPVYPRPYICLEPKWNQHNGMHGDDGHLSQAEFEASGASVIVVYDRIGPTTILVKRSSGIGVGISPDQLQIGGAA